MHNTFGVAKNINRLRVLRAEHRKSQLDTSRAARIKEYRYWRIENGYEEPSEEEQRALARVFRVGPTDVFPQPVTSKAS